MALRLFLRPCRVRESLLSEQLSARTSSLQAAQQQLSELGCVNEGDRAELFALRDEVDELRAAASALAKAEVRVELLLCGGQMRWLRSTAIVAGTRLPLKT